jgi:hypothetical protein
VIYRSPFFFQDAPKSGLGFRPVAGDALTASVSIIHCEGHARQLGILGKNHCQHSTSGACPSADPGMKSVGLSEDIKQYMMLER